jgi:hypothetical protein
MLLLALAVAAPLMAEEHKSCQNMRCGPGLRCVKPGKCLPLTEKIPDEGLARVVDLELYGCINGGGSDKEQALKTALSPAQAKALDCLERFGYMKNKPVDTLPDRKVCAMGDAPKLGCANVRWDSERCRWVCGRRLFPSR